jgi:hypothetical protein
MNDLSVSATACVLARSLFRVERKVHDVVPLSISRTHFDELQLMAVQTRRCFGRCPTLMLSWSYWGQAVCCNAETYLTDVFSCSVVSRISWIGNSWFSYWNYLMQILSGERKHNTTWSLKDIFEWEWKHTVLHFTGSSSILWESEIRSDSDSIEYIRDPPGNVEIGESEYWTRDWSVGHQTVPKLSWGWICVWNIAGSVSCILSSLLVLSRLDASLSETAI